jgi:hypothetical protein
MLDDILKIITRGNRRHGHDYYRDSHDLLILELARKLLRNPIVLALLAFFLLACIAATIWLIIALVPFAGKLLVIAEKQGLKEIVNMFLTFLQRLWEGSGR